MNVPLNRKTVRMERHVGADTQQVVVEGSFALPAHLPDIARIVRVEAFPVVTDRSALEEEVVVHGAVDFVIVYAHDEEVARPARTPPAPEGEPGTEIEAEQGFEADAVSAYGAVSDDLSHRDDAGELLTREVLHRHRWRRGAAFETVFDVPGAHELVTTDARADVMDIDVHLHGNGRGVDVEAVVAVSLRVSDYDSQDVFVKGDGFPASIDLDERALSVEHVLARGRTSVSVEGTLPLSSETPARTVADVRARVHLHDVDIDIGADGDARMYGKGSVSYGAVVMDADGELDSFAWRQQTPFTFSLEGVGAYGAEDGVRAVVQADAFVRGLDAAPAADGRGIEVFADIDIAARAATVESLKLLTGMAGDGEWEIRYRSDTFRLEQWIGQHGRELSATGQLDLPQGHPPVERMLGTEAKARVEDVLVLGDKVLIEGQFDVSGLYIARTEGNPAHHVRWHRALVMEGEVPVPGAEPGMEADVKVDIVDVELDLLNRETAEATVRFHVEAKVTSGADQEAVVEAVAVPPPDADPPTLTFVVVQADDTLWKLSHRYHTDIGDIVRANAWLEAPESALTPGRKLCVPRGKPAAPAQV